MIDIAWIAVVILWAVMATTYSITKIKVHRCGGGIYDMENYPLSKKEKWLLRFLILTYILLAFFIAYQFEIPGFDDYKGIAKPYFVKFGFIIFLIAQVNYIRARIAISSGCSWEGTLVRDRKTLIKTGPYHKVRHPQFGAFVLAILATGIMLLKGSILLFLILIIPLMILRMKVEEEILNSVFLKEYPEYTKETRILL
jgi:protein-S-isoprenylcysteine O-methyltransferase Ste14